jgi:hypothetical protein
MPKKSRINMDLTPKGKLFSKKSISPSIFVCPILECDLLTANAKFTEQGKTSFTRYSTLLFPLNFINRNSTMACGR